MSEERALLRDTTIPRCGHLGCSKLGHFGFAGPRWPIAYRCGDHEAAYTKNAAAAPTVPAPPPPAARKAKSSRTPPLAPRQPAATVPDLFGSMS